MQILFQKDITPIRNGESPIFPGKNWKCRVREGSLECDYSVEEPKEENVSEKKEIQNAYRDLAFEYFLELNDCKKSLEYLEKIKKEDEQAKDLEVIIKAVENEKSEINRTALKNHLKSLEESMIQEKADQYCQCLIRGYGMLTGEQAAENILRLGNQYLEQEHIGKSEKTWQM